MAKHPFEHFLDSFVPKVAQKSRQLNKAVWILETTGSADAADAAMALNHRDDFQAVSRLRRLSRHMSGFR
jgi:hypothetical protein